MSLADDLASLDALDKLAGTLRGGLPELDRRARIPSRRDGYPARASGSQVSTSVPRFVEVDMVIVLDYGDPTGEAAITSHRPDPVTIRHRRAVRELARALRALEIAAAQLREPADVDEGGPWCASCARVKHDDGRPHLNPSWSRVKGRSDVGGRLKEPMYLCRLCYEHTATYGVLPARVFLSEYLHKGRAPRRTA